MYEISKSSKVSCKESPLPSKNTLPCTVICKETKLKI